MKYIATDISTSLGSPDSFRYLSHYGVLGMKWGVRRFQNQDGTLKAAGKGRYDGEAMPKSQLGKATNKTVDSGKKVSAGSIRRQLNRNERRMARDKQRLATARVNSALANSGYNKKRQEKAAVKLQKAEARVKAGEKKASELLKIAKKNNYNVKSKDVIRYTARGEYVVGALTARPSTISYTRSHYAKQAMKYSQLYDSNYSGMIKGKKYKVRKQ